MISLSQRKSGAILGYVNVIAKNAINLIYTPLLLRFLSQGDYGVFQMVNAAVMSLSLLNMGFSSSYIRFYSRKRAVNDEEGLRKLNGMFLIVFIAISLVCFSAGLFLWSNTSLIFNKGLTSDQVILAKALILIMIINLAIQFPASVFDSYIVAHERFIFQQTRQLLTSLATPCIAVILLICGFGAIGVASAQLFITFILFGLNIKYAVKNLGMRFIFVGFDFPLFKEIAIFSFWIFLNQIFDLVNNNVPNLVLGAVSGATTVAVFAIAMQIRTVFMSLSSVISNVFVPKINQIVSTYNDNRDLTQLMIKSGRYQMIVFFLLYGGFALVGKFFVEVWAGSGYSDAYWMILIMTLPLAVPLSQNTGIEIQRAKNMHKARSIVYIFTSVINVFFSFALAHTFGYWATTWGYVISIVLGTGLFMNWYYHVKIGLNMISFWKNMLPIIISAAAVYAVCKFFSLVTAIDGWCEFFCCGFLYVLLFCLVMWWFVLTPQEKAVFLGKR